MRAHEAGELHAELGQPHATLPPPRDLSFLHPAIWPRHTGRDSNGAVTLSGIDVRALAEEFGTPAYICDEDDFRSRCQEFRAAFQAASPTGEADVSYAAKAFCSVAVLRWVAEEGLGVDVCTDGELSVALAARCSPDRITMHGNNKSVAELDRAVLAGVKTIVVDSFVEIDRLRGIAQRHGICQQVLIRATVGVEAHTHEFIATAHEDQKFGFSLADGDAFAAARQVCDSPSLDLVGIHSHIGSQIFDTAGFEVAAHRAVGLLVDIRQHLGVELGQLNLGGGMGIAYQPDDDPVDTTLLAKQLTAIVSRECAAAQLPTPRIGAEPGRAIAGPATFTLYEVGTVKKVNQLRTYVSVDGGMSDNIRPALYGAAHSCTLASRVGSTVPMLSRIVGKHCESGDIVVRDAWLPADIRPGDMVAVASTGAYCRSMASNYNYVPRPPVIAVRNGQATVIVRRETSDDLMRLDVAADLSRRPRT